MPSEKVVELSLSSGNAIPLLGYGTAVYPFQPLKMKQAVLKAIELGYRHFDTASLYQTEKPLGEAVREAIKLGLIKSREELFVTSKLWCSDAHHDRVLPALQNTLRNLGLEYLDLYLIHWPVSVKTGGNYEIFMGKEELMPMDFSAVWKAMEECQKLGLTKAIGVSNFSCKKLQAILDVATIPPAVNQVEMSPCWQQKKLRDLCKEKGIHITAWSPLGAKGTPWGTNRVMESHILQNIAKARGKTLAQDLRNSLDGPAYEQGVIVIVKSFNEDRMKENLGIYDWELSDEDYRQLEKISQEKGFTYSHITGEGTPFETLDDLWDGEF